tara:strand:- start:42 stop:161 length:120 start_codon:yes stop_codon:yes gene_type:complete
MEEEVGYNILYILIFLSICCFIAGVFLGNEINKWKNKDK